MKIVVMEISSRIVSSMKREGSINFSIISVAIEGTDVGFKKVLVGKSRVDRNRNLKSHLKFGQ